MDAFSEEIEVGNSVESFLGLLNSQRELFHSQIDQLQEVVVKQCKLTGVNPLAQEMAAGALSIKIGKRPRDLLNPKAIKHMQSIFSIKDSISKKESREIGARYGITVSQVRDFFVNQRSRVRKQVRLARDKALKTDTCTGHQDEVPVGFNAPADTVPLGSSPAALDLGASLPPVSLNSVEATNHCQATLTLPLDGPPSVAESSDKHFVENIFSMMHKEETFSGQVKLMEWILQMQNPSILIWFLTNGGVIALTNWLSQAAFEEQTTVLLSILKVLCHLPLHKASPENMSAILQSVNKLRSYRAADISNRARVLLSKWSKLFAKIQAIKKPNGMKQDADAHSQKLLKQSIVEIMGEEGDPDELFPSNERSENVRKLEPVQPVKHLAASAEDLGKRSSLGPPSSYNRERRKVQLVEQPGQTGAGRAVQASRYRKDTANYCRPMSADDIQKAKMRALFRQNKFGKKDSPTNVNSAGDASKPLDPKPVNPLPLPNYPHLPKTREQNIAHAVPLTVSKKLIHNETNLDKLKVMELSWKTPPEIRLNDTWRVGAGDSSKEIVVQRNRNRREKETVYRMLREIPLNPKEPWDREMDYDDTLTLEIPTEQPPDVDTTESIVTEPKPSLNEHLNASASSSHGGTSEPDLELLAALLKNPQLVFALTSGTAGSLSSNDTVRLLDGIKSGGAGSAGSAGKPIGVGNKVEEKVEVSLPSPTPAVDPAMGAWRQEALRNPFSKHSALGNSIVSSIPTMERVPPAGYARSHVPVANKSVTVRQPTLHIASVRQQVSSVSSRILPEQFEGASFTHQVATQYQNSRLQPQIVQQTALANCSANPQLYASREQMDMGAASDSWTVNSSAYYRQPANSSGYHYIGIRGNGESWSPNKSPSRSNGTEWGYRVGQFRSQNSPGYWELNRYGDRLRDNRR